MALTYRSGAGGAGIALGKQTNLETPVTTRSGMTPVLFPVSALTLGPADEAEDSNLISSYGAAPPVEPGQEWGVGGAVMRILPRYFHHILEGILNPVTAASVALTGAAAAITTSSSGAAFANVTPAKQKPVAGAGAAGAPANWPSKINIDGGTVASGPVNLKLKGLRRGGRRSGTGTDRLATFYQEETIEIPNGAISNIKSKQLWDTIQTVDWELNGGSITGTTTLTWDPDTFKTTLQFQLTDPQHPGYTLLNLVGGRPDRMIGYIMSELNISASGSGIDATFDGIGTRYDRAKTINTDATFDDDVHALDAGDTAYYANPPLKSFPGWAGALAFGDIMVEENIVKYSSIDFSINRNYGPAEGIDGRKFRQGVAQSDNRLVTFSPTALMRWGVAGDSFKNYHELYRAGTREKLVMRNLSYHDTGRQEQMDWTCSSAQIAEMPTNEVSGPGAIEEPLVFRALQDGTTPELVIEIYTETALYS